MKTVHSKLTPASPAMPASSRRARAAVPVTRLAYRCRAAANSGRLR
ncbi:hypothetical protein ABGB07_33205 [Micromonosporaceae bacterium B7E4]